MMAPKVAGFLAEGRRRKVIWFGAFWLILYIALILAVPQISTVNPLGAQGGARLSTLELHIIDGEVGVPIPARIQIVSADGETHIAEDALWFGGDCRDLTVHGEHLEDALEKQSLEVKNPLAVRSVRSETTQFYSNGHSVIRLPAGRARISVFKGPEYLLAEHSIVIPESETREYTVELSRLANMPEEGWYSSDGHLHIARPTDGINPHVSKIMQAEGVHVANLLLWGKADTVGLTPQYAHGPPSWYREGDYILAAGLENPRTHFLGHTITLGANEPLHNPETYLIYRLLWEEAVEEGALNGYAHLGTLANAGRHSGLSLVLPYGLMHFLEVLQANRLDYSAWYDVLNLGFRVTPTAGTDFPCIPSIPGHERFYTKVDGPYDYEGWLEAVRLGKTFVTTGPLLDFTVSSKDVGSEVSLREASEVLVEARVRYDPAKDDILGLELVQNGSVVRSFPQIDDTGEMFVSFHHPIEQTSWLALRGYGNQLVQFLRGNRIHGTTVHSAPIYVTVENTPPLASQPTGRSAARTWLAQLENLEIRLNDTNMPYLLETVDLWHKRSRDGFSKELLLRNRMALLDEIAHARTFYMEFLK